MKVKKILVPTDFSEFSYRAVEYASELCGFFKARLILIHVKELYPYGPEESFMILYNDGGLRETLTRKIEKEVLSLKNKKIETEGHFLIGEPYSEIIDCAKKWEVDMIVMGTHGRKGLSHLFLGSTAERVVRLAPCPVLVVKEGSEKRRATIKIKNKTTRKRAG